ncbi:hypothetical protein AB1Y20_015067 [Prymnesium parvum]|uniref:Uncharacterized protein n=1 Tax=Prymnesium parvum TaxID=97485 RepID=A0AB34JW04_PRYPA
MGCLLSCHCCRDDERSAALRAPLLPLSSAPTPPASTPGEASAVDFFNAITAGFLPSVRLSIARKLLEFNRNGGLRLPAGYVFTVRRRSLSAAALHPSEVVDTLRVELLHVKVAQKVGRVLAARGFTPAARASAHEQRAAHTIQRLFRRALACRRWVAAATMARGSAQQRLQSVRIEAEALIMLDFFHDTVDFHVGPLNPRSCAPSASLELKTLHLRARLRLLWDLPRSKLLVSFLEAPDVQFNLELELGGLQLPDMIEDRLLPWAIARQLAARNSDNPIEFDLGLLDA